MINLKSITAAAALSILASSVHAMDTKAAWTLDPTMSNVSFGSIKNDYVGESHSFGQMSGSVSQTGKVQIELGLASVETSVDKRNGRMIEHVFNNAPKAMITAQLDLASFADLGNGEARTFETTGTLSFLGEENELDASFFVVRLTEDKVLVTTDGMVMLSTTDAGIDAGIDKLQELAGLDSITRVSPVTLRLMFNAGS